MRPAPECIANRDEWGADNSINPIVLWTLTPRIISLDVEYFGVMWPNNSAVGASYGGILDGAGGKPGNCAAGSDHGRLAGSHRRRQRRRSARRPQMPRPATACAPLTRACRRGQRAPVRRHRAGQDIGSQVSTFMQPVQSMMGAVPQALQAPTQLMQAPMSAMQPLQSMMGMFANPGALGGAAPAGVGSLGGRCDFRPPKPGHRWAPAAEVHPWAGQVCPRPASPDPSAPLSPPPAVGR